VAYVEKTGLLASPHVAFHMAVASRAANQAVRYASSSSEPLSKTQLYDLHVEHGEKGDLHVAYVEKTGLLASPHVAFHMAQIRVLQRNPQWLTDFPIHRVQHQLSGPGAIDLLKKVTPSSVSRRCLRRGG
jgi:aminomethyltransferase